MDTAGTPLAPFNWTEASILLYVIILNFKVIINHCSIQKTIVSEFSRLWEEKPGGFSSNMCDYFHYVSNKFFSKCKSESSEKIVFLERSILLILISNYQSVYDSIWLNYIESECSTNIEWKNNTYFLKICNSILICIGSLRMSQVCAYYMYRTNVFSISYYSISSVIIYYRLRRSL